MKKLVREINLVLAGWNPIGVDGNVAMSEYQGYIGSILTALKENRLLLYLEELLLELGLEYDSTNELQSMEVRNVSEVLENLYKNWKVSQN